MEEKNTTSNNLFAGEKSRQCGYSASLAITELWLTVGLQRKSGQDW